MHGFFVFFHHNHMVGVLLGLVGLGALAVAVLRTINQRSSGDGGAE